MDNNDTEQFSIRCMIVQIEVEIHGADRTNDSKQNSCK